MESEVGGVPDEGPCLNGGETKVLRQKVEATNDYRKYREHLRHDFWYSCAYCTLMETEGGVGRFVIDHYEPRVARPDLLHTYENLMWACDRCNALKGDLCPPPKARIDGHRFLRPDKDEIPRHLRLDDQVVVGISPTGLFTTEILDLNRAFLRKLRILRAELDELREFALEGVRALQRTPIDLLPPKLRLQFVSQKERHIEALATALEDTEACLRQYARSPLLDPDPEKETRAKGRRQYLSQVKALYPGQHWRHRGKPRLSTSTAKRRSK